MLLKHFLKSQPIFFGLSDRDLDALARALEVREHPDKHAIIQEGRTGKELYLLIEGEVQVSKYNTKTGQLEPINRVKPGELFGLLALIDHSTTTANCIAVGPVKVGVLQRNAFNLLAQASAPIAHGFQIATAKQLASVLRHQEKALSRIAHSPDHSA